MEQHTEIAQPRSIFGRRKVVPRATVVDGKTHNRVFLTETLGELGLIAHECPADPCSIMDTAPDLVVLGISGGDAVEISRILHCLADAAFDGSAGGHVFQFHNITSQDLKLGVRWNLDSPPVYQPPLVTKG